MTSNRLTIRAGIWYTFSNFLSKGIGFLTTPFFTRVLTKTEFGDYNNFVSWQSIIIIIGTLELSSTITRAKYDYENDIDGYISSICITSIMICGIFYSIVVIFQDFFIELFSMNMLYINLLFIYVMLSSSINMLQTKHRIYLKYKCATFITIMSSLASVILSITFVFIMDDKLLGRILGQNLSLCVFNFVILIYLLYKGKEFNVCYVKYALSIAVPLVPHLLANNILGTSDRIMIRNFCGAEETALYSLAYSCSLIASLLWTSMNQAIVPWLYDNLNKKKYKSIKKISRLYLLLFVILIIFVLLVTPELVILLGGLEYKETIYILPPVIIACCFQFTYSMYVNVEFYEKKTFKISIGTMYAAIINLLLNLVFIPIFGYIAAAYTTLFCYILLLIFHFISVKSMGYIQLYDNKFNLFILIFCMILMFIALFIYRFTYIRYIILILYLIIFLITLLRYRKQIFRALN